MSGGRFKGWCQSAGRAAGQSVIGLQRFTGQGTGWADAATGQFAAADIRRLDQRWAGGGESIAKKKGVSEPLDVGIRAINSLFTVGRGQRLGLFAGSGRGKSKLLGMMTRFTLADVVIVALIGERGWEVKDFIEHSLGPAGLQKAIVIAAPADQSPLLRLRAAELSHRLAAYYRDLGLNVLLLMDSLTRYAQAQREIALSVGEPPATKGYPPSVFSKLTQLVEKAGNSADSTGTMTAIYTVLAEGDDQQDPDCGCRPRHFGRSYSSKPAVGRKRPLSGH